MSPELLRRAEAIFVEASERPAPEREGLLQARCGGDAALLAEVRALLALATQAGDSFLNPEEIRQLTADGSGLDAPPTDEPALPAGTRVAGYTVQSVLGAGGMGLVYLAEQERPKRTVALKLIRRGFGARGILRRFEHEAEILGLLHHPGIAQIYEAGTAQVGGVSQPFIAMEYVRGASLTAYAKNRQLATREQLALMMRVCEAVHHAHQRGIIHRDLKPGNILVDEAGQPKILDFGVARAMHTDIRVTTMRTSVGQLIGTLAYMSPEQVVGDPSGVDTRSDVYALGVLLYEVLTGRLPHDLASRSLPEAARAIRQDPPTKLSHVSRVFRGEIDTIVSKALEKEKERRYQSAAELAEDLRRYLAGEAIHARQDSLFYVLRKQLRRHRWSFAAAAIMLIGLIAFAVYAGVRARAERALAQEARLARRDAITERDRANETNTRLAEELAHAAIERGRLEAAAGNLSLAEDHLWRAYLEDPSKPAARWALWELYRREPTRWSAPVTDAVSCGFVTPDGRALVAGTRAGDVVWFDTGTGREQRRVKALGAAVVSIAIAPDQSCVALGMINGKTILVPAGGGPPRTLAGGPGSGVIFGVAFSPDGSTVASAGDDRTVHLWDVPTGVHVRSWEAHEQGVTTLVFSPDGKRLATGARLVRDGVGVRIWSVDDGRMLQEFGPFGIWATGMMFLPDSSALLVGWRDGSLVRLKLDTGARDVLVRCDNSIWPPIPSPDGSRLLVVGGDEVHVLDRADMALVRSIGRLPHYVMSAGWADDRTVIVVLNDGSIRAIEPDPEPELRRIGGFLTWNFGIDYSPDGTRLAIGSTGEVRLVDGATLATVWSIMPEAGNGASRTRAVRFAADGQSVLIGSSDGLVKRLRTSDGSTVASWGEKEPEAYSIATDPQERLMAVGYGGGSIAIWDAQTGALVGRLPRQPRRVETVAISPDGRTLASSGQASAVQLWDLQTRQAGPRLVTNGDVWGVAYSPDGASIFASTYEGTLEVFDAATGQRRAFTQGHGRLIPGLTLSRDGRVIATGAEDGTIKLWDSASLRALLTLEPGLNEIVSVRFDPSSRYLAAATSRRMAVVYDLKALDHCIEGNEAYHRARLRLPR